jgi:hypothetical protein
MEDKLEELDMVLSKLVSDYTSFHFLDLIHDRSAKVLHSPRLSGGHDT